MPVDDLIVRVVTSVAASRDRVWDVLTDLSSYRSWHPNLELRESADETLPLAVGRCVRLRTNRGTAAELEFDVTVTDVEAPSVLAWEGGDPEVFYGYHRFILTSAGANTLLVNEERFAGAMAAAVLSGNRAIIENQYTVGDAALKRIAEG